jgi:hypothetical protein
MGGIPAAVRPTRRCRPTCLHHFRNTLLARRRHQALRQLLVLAGRAIRIEARAIGSDASAPAEQHARTAVPQPPEHRGAARVLHPGVHGVAGAPEAREHALAVVTDRALTDDHAGTSGACRRRRLRTGCGRGAGTQRRLGHAAAAGIAEACQTWGSRTTRQRTGTAAAHARAGIWWTDTGRQGAPALNAVRDRRHAGAVPAHLASTRHGALLRRLARALGRAFHALAVRIALTARVRCTGRARGSAPPTCTGIRRGTSRGTAARGQRASRRL